MRVNCAYCMGSGLIDCAQCLGTGYTVVAAAPPTSMGAVALAAAAGTCTCACPACSNRGMVEARRHESKAHTTS